MKYKELENEHYKYIHILWRSPKIFSPMLINTINNNPDCFRKEDHVFVTNMPELFDLVNEDNMIFIRTSKRQPASIVNYVAEHCDYIFIHCMCSPIELLKIKRYNLKKIIWRTWGGDTSYLLQPGQINKNIAKKVINQFTKNRYRQIKAVGVANIVDAININELYGINNVYILSYGLSDKKEVIGLIPEKDDNKEINICVGHSGYKDDDHINVFKMLKPFFDASNKCMNIFVPLVYGDEEYIIKIKGYGKLFFGDKVIFLEERMTYIEYANMLNNMDIGIFNGIGSYALGNISILVFLKKTLVINSKGIIKKGFDAEKIPYITTDDLKTITLNELTQKMDYSKMIDNPTLCDISRDIRKSYWGKLLRDLDE